MATFTIRSAVVADAEGIARVRVETCRAAGAFHQAISTQAARDGPPN